MVIGSVFDCWFFLFYFCPHAANQHQIAHLRLDPANAARVGLYLVQVQEESFKLGLRLALKLVQDLMDVD